MSTIGLTREEILQRLNGLLAEEMEASIRYLHLAMAIEGSDKEKLAPMLKENYEETIEHAQLVGDKIVEMGGVPGPEIRLDLPAEKIDATDAIQIALAFEQAALDAYCELLELLEGSGDSSLVEFARSQVELETQHVAELQQLLES